MALHWQQSLRACSQSLGVPALPGACAGTWIGLCPAPAGMLQAARSSGLCPGLQVGAAAWETTQGPHSPSQPGAPCCWPGPWGQAAGQGQEKGAGEVGEELEITLPSGHGALSGAGGTVPCECCRAWRGRWLHVNAGLSHACPAAWPGHKLLCLCLCSFPQPWNRVCLSVPAVLEAAQVPRALHALPSPPLAWAQPLGARSEQKLALLCSTELCRTSFHPALPG